MYYTDEDIMLRYVNDMNLLKKMNKEYIQLRDGKEYSIGREIEIVKNCIVTFDFKKLIKKIQSKYRLKCALNSFEKAQLIVKNVKENYFSSERIAIYTCIIGDYDTVSEPLFVPDNCDFYLVTDRKRDLSENSCWEQIEVDRNLPNLKRLDNAGLNRYFKMHPDKLFNDYKYSIYIDGNIKVIGDLTAYINLIPDVGIAVHQHGKRNCVYEEAKTIVALGKADKKSIQLHLEKLKEMDFPKKYGLLECNIIAREHNLPTCKSIMNMWWDDYNNLSKRDQMSLPSVLFRHKIRVEDIATLGIGVENDYLVRVERHR